LAVGIDNSLTQVEVKKKLTPDGERRKLAEEVNSSNQKTAGWAMTPRNLFLFWRGQHAIRLDLLPIHHWKTSPHLTI